MTAYAKRELLWKEDSIKERNAVEQELRSKGAITEAKRMLNIDQMGIWNCDRPISPLPMVIDIIYYTSTHDEKLDLQRIYLVDKTLNTVFSYNLSAWNGSIKVDPSHDNFLYGIIYEKKFFIATPDALKKVDFSGKEVTVQMTELETLTDIELALGKIQD